MTEENARRLALTLNASEYARVRAHARQAGRPVATIAKRLLLGAMDNHDPDWDEAASRARDRIRHLKDEVTRLQAQLDDRQASDLMAGPPRWRWPLDALLRDREWWDEWLPSLCELLGSNLPRDRGYADRPAQPAVDDRGFFDLMSYLFPDLDDERGTSIRWHSPDYGRCARTAWETDRLSTSLNRQRRADVWEPVVRHVALALTALETTSQHPGDAYTHLRVEAEIRNEWLRTLGIMVGDEGSQRQYLIPSAPLT